MFDIGFPELLLLSVVALLVLGPERLPGALRTLGLWLGRIRRSFSRLQGELEREIGMDDIRRQLHNESVLAEARKAREELEKGAAAVRSAAANPLGALDDQPAPADAAVPATPADDNPDGSAGHGDAGQDTGQRTP